MEAAQSLSLFYLEMTTLFLNCIIYVSNDSLTAAHDDKDTYVRSISRLLRVGLGSLTHAFCFLQP